MSDQEQPEDLDAHAKRAAAARRAWATMERAGGLVNLTEIADRWGVEKQTVRGYRDRHPAGAPDAWPEPVQKFGRVELFLAAEVDLWRATPRRRGPRPKHPQDR